MVLVFGPLNKHIWQCKKVLCIQTLSHIFGYHLWTSNAGYASRTLCYYNFDMKQHICSDVTHNFITSNWKFWNSILPSHSFSRSSESWHVIHNDIICSSFQSQVHLINSYRDMLKWNFSRSIWHWPNFSRSSTILQVIHNDIIYVCFQP